MLIGLIGVSACNAKVVNDIPIASTNPRTRKLNKLKEQICIPNHKILSATATWLY